MAIATHIMIVAAIFMQCNDHVIPYVMTSNDYSCELCFVILFETIYIYIYI